jgi:ketosteroid isomerase-like protein
MALNRSMGLCAFLLLVSLSSARFVLSAQSDARTEVLAAEDARLAAMEHGEITTVANYIHPDFSVTGANGQVSDRATYLKRLSEATGPRAHLVHDEVQVRVYGTTAIISGRSRSVVNGVEQPQASRYTHVYVKDANGWRMVAMHVSSVR